MNDILNELFEEFPELKEDSEKLQKVVEYLEKSKPDIQVSIEFKDSLRKRLDNIIELKQGKSKSKWKILVPAFSFCFIAVLFFAFYKDFGDYKPNSQIEQGIDNNNLKLDGAVDIRQNDEAKGAGEVYDEIDEQDLMEVSEIVNDAEFEEIESIIDESEKMLKGIPETLNEVIDSPKPIKVEEKENLDRSGLIEKDQVIDEEVDNVMNMMDQLFEGIIDDKYSENLSTGGVGQDINLSFEDFCKQNSGRIVHTGKGKTCRTSGKECSISNYSNGTCEFVPLN